MLSPSFSLVTIENQVNFELSGKKEKIELAYLKSAQDFFCDYLPVVTRFIYKLNYVRSELHGAACKVSSSEITDEEAVEIIKKCDELLAREYSAGVDFVTNWAVRYFEDTKKVEGVTITTKNYFSENEQPCVAIVRTKGVREQDLSSLIEDDSVAKRYKKAPSEENHKVGVFFSNNLIECFLDKGYKHPNIVKRNHSSAGILNKLYTGNSNKICLWTRKKITAKVATQWTACWDSPENAIGSVCAFPVTLANNNLSRDLEDLFFGPSTRIDKNEVFSLLLFESKNLNAFDKADVLIGKILADALFAFDGATAHYRYGSRLRNTFGDTPISAFRS